MSVIGRNAPCPCGSGRKHKFCCLTRARAVGGTPPPPAGTTAAEDTHLTPRFHYEPGSYAAPGAFLPRIACLDQHAPDEWRHHFVLVIPDLILEAEPAAVELAEQHLSQALQDATSPAAFAGRLRSLGYVSVEGFQVADTA